MRVYSHFKIGLVLIVISSIWIAIVFSSSEKISYHTDLEAKEMKKIIFERALEMKKAIAHTRIQETRI